MRVRKTRYCDHCGDALITGNHKRKFCDKEECIKSWRVRSGGPRTIRHCICCGDAMPWSKLVRRLCGKEECYKKWRVDCRERVREKRRQEHGVRTCLGCGIEMWSSTHRCNYTYCSNACRATYKAKQREELRKKLERIAHLETYEIADRFGIGIAAARYRLGSVGLKRTRQRSFEESKIIKQKIFALLERGVKQTEIAKRLGVSRNVVFGHVHQERHRGVS